MRMQQCPHCGAANSSKRETCYQCQQALGPLVEEAQPASGSRWERLERVPGKAARRALRPVEKVGPRPPATPARAARVTDSMPTFRRPLVHVRRMAVFFRELHALARGGVTIGAACEQLVLRAPRPFRGLCKEMAAAAQAGRPLHEVMARHRDLFQPWHVGLVRAAQMGGALPEAFDQIARACELEWVTRAAILLRVFFYAVFLLPAVLVVIPLVLMLGQPIPKEGWTPGQLIGVALGYFRTVSLPIVVGLVAAGLAWQALSATAWFQGVHHRIVAHLPLAGEVAGALPDMLAKAAEMCRRDLEARRKRLLIAFGVALSAFWLLIVGLVVAIGIRAYFDFMLRALDWMMQG